MTGESNSGRSVTDEKPQVMPGESNSGQPVSDVVQRPKYPLLDMSHKSCEFPRQRTGPQSGTYLVQLPRDQIFRVPPPENNSRYEYLSRRKPHGTRCRRCFCTFLSAVLVLAVLAAIAAGILYLVYRPQKPRFSLTEVSITGFNLTSSSPISPEFDVAIRSSNPNGKLSLFYEKGSATELSYDGINLGNGVLPPYKQPPKSVTLLVTAIKGSGPSGTQFTGSMRKELTEAQKKGAVPFSVRIEAPIKIRVGSVKAWAMTFKVNCKITVDKLTASANVVMEKCDTGLNLR